MSRMNFLSSCPSRVTSRRNSRLNRRRRRRAYCCSSNKIIRKSDIIFLKSQKQFLAQMFRNIFLCLSLFIFPFRCRNSKVPKNENEFTKPSMGGVRGVLTSGVAGPRMNLKSWPMTSTLGRSKTTSWNSSRCCCSCTAPSNSGASNPGPSFRPGVHP